MYNRDVPLIASAMRAKPAVFYRGTMFAILSARVQFSRVPDQMTDMIKRGPLSRALWGWKFNAFHHLNETDILHALHAKCKAATNAADCIRALVSVPGLGIVKAAFVAQMLGFDVACLDSRNLAREGIDADRWKSRGAKAKAMPHFERMLLDYIENTNGRSRELWDQWCSDVARDNGVKPSTISRAHYLTIVPKPARRNLVPMRGLPLPAMPEIPF